MAVELAQDLAEWLPDDLEIEPTLAWNFPSIEALAGYLAGEALKDSRPIAGMQGEQGEQSHGIPPFEGKPRPVREQGEIDALSEDELARSLLEEIALAQGRDN